MDPKGIERLEMIEAAVGLAFFFAIGIVFFSIVMGALS